MGSATSRAEEQERRVVRLRFPILPWQERVRELQRKYPFVVVNAGVYTGKTVFGAALLTEDMILNPGEVFWWVAGLKFQLDAMWEQFAPMARRLGAHVKSHPYLFARLPNGAKLHCVSAENVEIISAHHPLAIYGDEVAKWRLQAWHMVRVRLLREGRGRGLFMSTPRPNHWRELVRWGREGKDGRWSLVECTTLDAGIVGEEEVKALQNDLPEELYQQEVMARILEGAGTVFRRVREASTGEPEEPRSGLQYLIGYDPAKLRDFAVAAVRQGNRIVWIERWKETAYIRQADLVADLCRRYNHAHVVMDATGPGQPVLELLRKANLKVTPVTFTNANKQTMVDDLALKLERGEIVLPRPTLGEPYSSAVDELTAFERRKTASGLQYTYSAPEGSHDDCVTALMLAFAGEAPEHPILAYYRERARKLGKEGGLPSSGQPRLSTDPAANRILNYMRSLRQAP